MKTNDPVAFSTATGATIHGRFIKRVDADTVLVQVGNRKIQVAQSACWKVEEAAIMREFKRVLLACVWMAVTFFAIILVGKILL